MIAYDEALQEAAVEKGKVVAGPGPKRDEEVSCRSLNDVLHI